MNHTTRCYHRSLRQAFGLSARDAIAIEVYRVPAHRRFFYALRRWGWAVVPAVLALSVLTGCDDLESYAADQASLADAIAQAAKEAGK